MTNSSLTGESMMMFAVAADKIVYNLSQVTGYLDDEAGRQIEKLGYHKLRRSGAIGT